MYDVIVKLPKLNAYGTFGGYATAFMRLTGRTFRVRLDEAVQPGDRVEHPCFAFAQLDEFNPPGLAQTEQSARRQAQKFCSFALAQTQRN